MIRTDILKVLSFLVLCTSCSTVANNGFSIKGSIADTREGDTLVFKTVELANYNLQDGFKIPIGRNGRISYKGTIEHEQFFLMTLEPAEGNTVPFFDRSGMELVIKPSDRLILNGDLDGIYFLNKRGGIYDDELYGEYVSLSDSLGYIRSLLFRELSRAQADTTDREAANVAMKALNDFDSNDSEAKSRKRELYAEYLSSGQGGLMAVIDMLRTISYSPYDEIVESWNKVVDNVRDSYYGRLLAQQIDAMERLAEGNDAPETVFRRSDSTEWSLGELRGKYVLLYQWGLCPGSMQVDPEVTKLYNATSRDKLIVLGLTDSREEYVKAYAAVSPVDSIYGMNIKERLGSMINHPYEDFDLNLTDAAEKFAFSGLPFFVLISPEGKILGRGFQEVFYRADDMLRKEESTD